MKFFKRTDIIIVLAIVVLGLVLIVFNNNILFKKSGKAEIYYESKLVKTVMLDKGIDKTFSIPQNKNVVFHLFKDGSICFEKSNCPDKICIKTGKLRRVGETAACLPNKIIMKIVPTIKSNNDLDMVVGR